MESKFHDEGDMFWTFYNYDETCFTDVSKQATSFNDCYDWSTVTINKVEYVNELNDCVDDSFEAKIFGSRSTSDEILGDMDTDNSILR